MLSGDAKVQSDDRLRILYTCKDDLDSVYLSKSCWEPPPSHPVPALGPCQPPGPPAGAGCPCQGAGPC